MKQAEKKLSTTTPKSSTPSKKQVQHGLTVQTGTKAAFTPGVVDWYKKNVYDRSDNAINDTSAWLKSKF